MSRQKPRAYRVRIHPDIWRDQDWVEACERDARWAYFDSLFYLALIGEPRGLYPHAPFAQEVGSGANRLADQLMAVKCWSFGGLGYYVHSYSGCAVVPEHRQPISMSLRERIYNRDGRQCLECGSTANLSLDHIFPWILGGQDTEDNLRTLCRPCNSSKGARIL